MAAVVINNLHSRLETKQELSYRKQIARQLRTQYVEGICRSNYPVTLKSELRVTQGHWKRKPLNRYCTTY